MNTRSERANESITLRDLFNRRYFFSNYPSCQREYIWKKTQQELLVDTILRGLPIPAIMVVPEYDELGGLIHWVVDGQQRIKTILRYMDNEFSTAKRFNVERDLIPISPGKKYQELDQATRNLFDNYSLPIVKIINVDLSAINAIFRRLQYGSKLTFAERLYSYDGTTKDIAASLEKHPIWNNIFDKPVNRKQPFQMGVSILILEQLSIFANCSTPRLVDTLLPRGTWVISPKEIERKLGLVMHLFFGSTISGISQIIPLYQTILIFEEEKYNLKDAERGCLTKWWMGLLSNDEYRLLIKDMSRVNRQRLFWEQNYEVVSDLLSGVKLDSRRTFNDKQKIKVWIDQGGSCALCGKELPFREAIADHTFPYVDGGKTELSNCRLLHEKCHTREHARKGVMNI